MRRLVCLFAYCILIYACQSVDQDYFRLSYENNSNECVDQTKSTTSIQELLKEEPYRLELIQQVLGDYSLQPTHKVVRIYPSDLETLTSFELDTSVIIIKYCQSSNESISYVPDSKSIIDGDITYHGTHGNIIANKIDINPIHILCPIDYTIPSNIKHQLLYEAFVPTYTQDNNDETRALKPYWINGQIRAYNNRLNQYIPVPHVVIQYSSTRDGVTSICYTSTNSSGNFTMILPDYTEDIQLRLQNTHFTVRNGVSSDPRTINLGTIAPVIFGETIFFQRDLPANYYIDVYTAASYYFYETNDLLNLINKYSSNISIFAFNENSDSIRGRFSYSPSGNTSPYITIYNPEVNNYSGAASKIFGTVLHELGHATQYQALGASSFDAADSVIVESFASFFGWVNVYQYFEDVVSSHSDVHSICTQGRQSWRPSTTSEYTPIFVDLFDDYNQNNYNSLYNTDTISNVPISVILDLSLDETSISSVITSLSSYVGTYFTSAQYSQFIAPYSIFMY